MIFEVFGVLGRAGFKWTGKEACIEKKWQCCHFFSMETLATGQFLLFLRIKSVNIAKKFQLGDMQIQRNFYLQQISTPVYLSHCCRIMIPHMLSDFVGSSTRLTLSKLRLFDYWISLFNRIMIDVWLLPILAAIYLMLLFSLCSFNRNWSALFVHLLLALGCFMKLLSEIFSGCKNSSTKTEGKCMSYRTNVFNFALVIAT